MKHSILRKGERPIPIRLSGWDSGTEVIYKCPHCDTNLAILSWHENFCHHCGVKLDWTTSVIYCSEEFKKRYTKLVYEEHMIPKDNNEPVQLLFDLYKNKYTEGSRYLKDL